MRKVVLFWVLYLPSFLYMKLSFTFLILKLVMVKIKLNGAEESEERVVKVAKK